MILVVATSNYCTMQVNLMQHQTNDKYISQSWNCLLNTSQTKGVSLFLLKKEKLEVKIFVQAVVMQKLKRFSTDDWKTCL